MATTASPMLDERIPVRHLGIVQPAEGGLWPSLEVVEHVGTERLALVLMSAGGCRQLGEGTSHDEVMEIAAQILSLKGEMIPAMLHKLALGYVALTCQMAQREKAAGVRP